MYFCRRRCEPTAAYSIAPPETMLSVYADGWSILENREKTAQLTQLHGFSHSPTFSEKIGTFESAWATVSKAFSKQPLIGIASRGSSHTSHTLVEASLHQRNAPWWYSSRRGLASRVGWCKCKVIVCALLGMPKPWESNYEPLRCCLTLDGPSGRENLRHDLVLSDARWLEHQTLCSVLLTTFWWFRLMP